MPMPIHEYPVTVNWTGGRDGSGDVSAEHSGENFPVAVPEEFQGPGGATNPEELLTSAIAACYTITFGIIAANRKLPVTGIKVDAVGSVDQSGATFTYKSVAVRPQIAVSVDATDEQIAMVEDMAHKADNYCIVTNAVRGKVEISVEPKVTRG